MGAFAASCPQLQHLDLQTSTKQRIGKGTGSLSTSTRLQGILSRGLFFSLCVLCFSEYLPISKCSHFGCEQLDLGGPLCGWCCCHPSCLQVSTVYCCWNLAAIMKGKPSPRNPPTQIIKHGLCKRISELFVQLRMLISSQQAERVYANCLCNCFYLGGWLFGWVAFLGL